MLFFNKYFDVTESWNLTEEETEVECRRVIYDWCFMLYQAIPDDLEGKKDETPIIIPESQPEPQPQTRTEPEPESEPEPEQQQVQKKRMRPLYQKPKKERRHEKQPKQRSFAWKGRQ